jgi:predicted NAD/FAD-dependent oxidoreductase
MLDAAHCDLRTGTTVRTLERTADGWSARTDSGTVEADRVVSTLPPARTAALLPDGPLAADLRAEADRVEYHALDSVVLGYDHPVERDWYAVATGDGREGGWLCRESAKPGHVPDGQAALVVQSRAAAPAAEAPVTTDQAAVAAADLLDEPRLADPVWTDSARYRFARPDHRAVPRLLAAAADEGLYLAGDWTAGTTRTLAPLETGLDAGRRAMGFAQQAALQ